MEYGQKVKIKEGFYKNVSGFVVAKDEKKIVGGHIIVKYLVQTNDKFEMREWFTDKEIEAL